MIRWVYPVLGLIILAMLGGLYTFSLFYKPLQEFYELTDVAPLAFAFSIATLTYSLSIIPAGSLYDRLGPKFPLLAGASFIFLGYLLASTMKSYEWETARTFYYLYLGVLPGIGIALVDAVPRPLAGKWFPEKPGIVVGIVAIGFGIGGALIAPLVGYFLTAMDIFHTFIALGLLYFAVISICSIPMKDPPVKKEIVSLDLRVVLKSKIFYKLWFAFLFSTFSGLLVIGNAATILLEGAKVTPQLGEMIEEFMVITSISNALGRVLWGALLDRVGVKKAMLLNFLTSSTSVILLSQFFATLLVFPLASIIYANYGGTLAIFPATSSMVFGRRVAGRAYGALFTAWGISGFIAPFFGALLRDLTNSYIFAFYSAFAVSSLALAVSITLPQMRLNSEKS
ncbi:MAG: MFS transporter [Archaeoglobaceae archaeon]